MSDRAKCASDACADDDEPPLGSLNKGEAPWPAWHPSAARPLSAKPIEARGDRIGTVHAIAPKGGGEVCGLDPGTRVLTAYLRWIAVADVEVGQELVACDEDRAAAPGSCRRMRTSVVETIKRTTRPAYRIRLDDGRSVVCSAQHRWLSRKSTSVTRWRSIGGSGDTRKLRPGDLVRSTTHPWGPSEEHDIWFGGIVDGEGSLVHKGRSRVFLSAIQCDGPVLQRMLGYCIARRYAHFVVTTGPRSTRLGRRPVHCIRVGSMSTLFRLLGLARPVRFIGVRWWEGRRLPMDGWRAIAAIEPLGELELVEIQTSTRTHLAEGFVSHDATAVGASRHQEAAEAIGASSPC